MEQNKQTNKQLLVNTHNLGSNFFLQRCLHHSVSQLRNINIYIIILLFAIVL